MLEIPGDRVLVAGNSSLELMHDAVDWAALRGVPGGAGPWSDGDPATFLCPVPGYDRHFTICEGLRHPDGAGGAHRSRARHGRRRAAGRVRPGREGMWCVPKYSNPDRRGVFGRVAERLARMKTAAPDFRLFWDNAYGVHHLSGKRHEIANILELCERHGHPDRAFVFASTSKMTFAGAGVSIFASSTANMKWMLQQMERKTIGFDKLNQLRHVRFLKDAAGIRTLMEGHAEILTPKFQEVHDVFTRLLGGTGAATWTGPTGDTSSASMCSMDARDG